MPIFSSEPDPLIVPAELPEEIVSNLLELIFIVPPVSAVIDVSPLKVAAPELIEAIVAAPPTETAPPEILEFNVPSTVTVPPEMLPDVITALPAKCVSPVPARLPTVIVLGVVPVKFKPLGNVLLFVNAPTEKVVPVSVALEVASSESDALVFRFTAVNVAPVSVTPEVPPSEPFAVANKLPPVTVVAPV